MKGFFLFFWVSWHSGVQIQGPFTDTRCEAVKTETVEMFKRRNTELREIYCKRMPE